MTINDVVPYMRFNSLTVLKEVEPKIYRDGYKARQFLCKCDCGNIKIVVGKQLIRNETKTCGKCPKIKITNSINYKRASKILDRCNNPNNEWFHRYGGRGIKCLLGETTGEVAKSLDSIPGYFDGAQIDRIDNDGDYELSNLRWVTSQENSMNKSNNLTLRDIENRSFTKKDFKRICDSRGWSVFDFECRRNTQTRNEWYFRKK